MSETRHLQVAVSVEQIATAWIRTEAAPAGAIVIVDHEVAGRLRLGVPWRVHAPSALSCATVVRPAGLSSDRLDLLWVVGLVAAAGSVEVSVGWPDTLVRSDGREVGAVGVEAQGDRGVVTSAVLSLRLDLSAIGLHERDQPTVAAAFAAHVSTVMRGLATGAPGLADLAAAHARVSTVIGRRVRAVLHPRGDVRGEAIEIDDCGALVLRSPTGMIERVEVSAVSRLEPV